MKPTKLTLKGLHSFSQEQVIDFDQLSQGGLFGIFGPTGSGKSTVLDGIILAIYGRIARVENKNDSLYGYINTQSDSAKVVLEFEVNDHSPKKYKILREIQKTKTGGASTKQIKIWDITEDEVLMAEKPTEFNKVIQQVIGLEYEEFIKTVVLPQGGFNDFLKMSGVERRSILQRLFGLEKYGEQLEQKIGKKNSQIKEQLNVIQGELKAYEGITQENIEEAEKELKNLQNLLRDSKDKKELLFTELKAGEQLYLWQHEAKNLEIEISKIQKNHDSIEQLKNQISNSNRNKTITPLIKIFDETVEAGKGASKELQELKEKLELVNNEKEKLDKAFGEIEQAKNDQYPQLLKRGELLSNSISRWESLIKNRGILENLLGELGYVQIQLEENEKLLEIDLKLKQTMDKTIEQKKIAISKTQKSESYKKNIRQGAQLYKSQLEYQERIDKIQKGLLSEIEKKKNLEDENQKLQIEFVNIEGEQKQLQEKADSILNNPLYSQEALGFEKENAKALLENINKLQEISHALGNYQKDFELAQKSYEENQKQQKQLQSAYEEKNQAYHYMILSQGVQAIRHDLKQGDICPVCANVVDVLPPVEEISLDSQRCKEELEAIEYAQRSLIQEYGMLATQKSQAQEQIVKLKEEQERLSSFGVYDSLEIEKNLQAKLLDNQKLTQELEQLQGKLKICADGINEKNNKLSINQGLIQGIQTITLKYQEEKQELENKLEQMEQAFKELDFPKEGNPLLLLENLETEEEWIASERIELINKEEELKELQGFIEEKREKLLRLKEDMVQKKESEKYLKEQITDDENFLKEKLGSVTNPETELRSNQEQIKRIVNAHEELKGKKQNMDEDQRKKENAHQSLAQKLENYRSQARNQQQQLYDQLQNLGIRDFSAMDPRAKSEALIQLIKELKSQVLSEEQTEELTQKIKTHDNLLAKTKGEWEGLTKKMGDKQISEEAYLQLKKQWTEFEEQHEKLSNQVVKDAAALEDKQQKFTRVKDLREQEGKIENEKALLNHLFGVIKGKQFVEYIAARQLSYVTEEATQRLVQITNGAYHLEVDDEGIFKIRDFKNGGVLRDVKTLSGGETFVVSLSLALALSTQIQLKGVVPLELFFLDEGFGTLDEELLDEVMDSLEKLHNDRLKIGIISHVEQLKQRVPIKLLITPAKQGEGGSRVKIEYS